MKIKKLIAISFMFLFFSGCSSFPDYYLGQGLAVSNGKLAIVFTVSNSFIESTGRQDTNNLINEVLEISLREVNLCPNGYVIHNIVRARNLDYIVSLDCLDQLQM